MSGRVLVTGGAGFIGVHLVNELIRHGKFVNVLDDLSTGRFENFALASVNAGRMSFIHGSTANVDKVRDAIEGCESVYHLASPVGVVRVMSQPETVLRSMIVGTQNVIDHCVENTVPLLLASSSEVYGVSPRIPTRETEPVVIPRPDSPRWHYAAGKAMNEHQAFAAREQHGLDVRIVRLFNVSGYLQSGRYGMVIPRFVRAALDGEILRVFGDGQQSRSFAHVSDVVEGIVELAKCPAACGEVVNLGSDESWSINGLSELVLEVVGAAGLVQHVPPLRAYGVAFEDVRKRMPCLEKARALIGYKPSRTTRDIISEMVSDYKTAGVH